MFNEKVVYILRIASRELILSLMKCTASVLLKSTYSMYGTFGYRKKNILNNVMITEINVKFVFLLT